MEFFIRTNLARFWLVSIYDGATYNHSATARDRDKIRGTIPWPWLEYLRRSDSPDWWYDKNSATDRLHEALQRLVLAGREQEAEKKVVDAAQAAQADGGMMTSQIPILRTYRRPDDWADVQQTDVVVRFYP
ncbi:hypothetical protein ACOJBO_02110 [Rhizobium beringeri]